MNIKKLTAWVAAVSVLSAAAVCTVSAAAMKSPQLVHLQQALLGITDVETVDDVNGDSTVNIFDMILLKRQLMQGTGEETVSDIAVTAENVKFTGRTYAEDSTTWLVQSGSAAEFTVTASSASITIAGDSGVNADEKYQPRYAVYVDDTLIEDSLLNESSRSIKLFEGDSSRTAKVKVMLLSEASYGAIGVQSVHVNSASQVPVKPEPEKDLCIEFIGDSITCAYGVEGTSSSDPFMTGTENFSKSYAYLTAQKLNADYSAVSYSGHGIVSGYSTGDKNADALIPDIYGLVSKRYEYSKPWNFEEARQNDVVVINLGTNDQNYVAAEPETRGQEFIDAYIDFLKTVREKNPAAYIICTVGTMGGENVYALIEQAVPAYKTETGDERILCYASAVQNSADGYGADWHPSAVTQQNSAYVLADKICQALGMESDQVGLDVAANAVYDLVIDDTNGANAAHYVGYDKSFWINMVSGGKAPKEIEAVLSGVELKENGVYRLEFNISTGAEVDIPILVRGSEVYFSDTLSCGSEKQHYSTEFTATASDKEASIVFQVGGTDYYNVTLDNIKLTKIQ